MKTLGLKRIFGGKCLACLCCHVFGTVIQDSTHLLYLQCSSKLLTSTLGERMICLTNATWILHEPLFPPFKG